jgi:hypothetical protein
VNHDHADRGHYRNCGDPSEVLHDRTITSHDPDSIVTPRR